jgi:putative pyruvate formate lyase activating enzyme
MREKGYPSYLSLKEDELGERVERLLKSLEHCTICPRVCGVNRLKDEIGECGVGRRALMSSYGPHFGEEPPLVGRFGSGTVFFAGCNLHCVFCQNYEISQFKMGRTVDASILSDVFLRIQDMGCHNLNLVSPTHVVPQVMEALLFAVKRGFNLPIVYNTGGYDSLQTLKNLDGVVDIYMPDIKYSDSEKGLKYSDVKGYWEVVRKSVKEMHRQVGDLIIENGIAKRGLLIRHLVLPRDIAGSEKVLLFVKNEISENSYVNIMDQYWPTHLAHKYEELSRRITREEYRRVVEFARKIGLKRGIPLEGGWLP